MLGWCPLKICRMRTLGIDYGRSKIGLAIAEGSLAEPWKVVAPDALKKILETESFDKIVVGVSSGAMGKEQKRFALVISHWTSAIIETFDETLTTKEAQRLSLEAGLPRKKRRGMEDAFAACLMLQSYLDENV